MRATVLFAAVLLAASPAFAEPASSTAPSGLLDRLAYPVVVPETDVMFAPTDILPYRSIVPFARRTTWEPSIIDTREIRQSSAGVEIPFSPHLKVGVEASQSQLGSILARTTTHYRFGDVTWIKSKKAIVTLTIDW